jgi:hypothetical protein
MDTKHYDLIVFGGGNAISTGQPCSMHKRLIGGHKQESQKIGTQCVPVLRQRTKINPTKSLLATLAKALVNQKERNLLCNLE